MTQDRARAREEFRKMMKWIVVIAVATVVLALLWLSTQGELRTHMVIATILGVFFSVLLGTGLFALAFFSDKSGHDANVTNASRTHNANAQKPDERKD